MRTIAALLILFLTVFNSLVSASTVLDSLNQVIEKADGKEKFNALVEKGLYYQSIDSLSRSEEWFTEAIRFGESKVPMLDIQIPECHLGLLYLKTWRPELSKEYFLNGIRDSKKQNDIKTQLLCQSNLGILYSRKLEFDSAEVVLNEALYEAVKQNDQLVVISILNSLAYIKEKNGNLAEAIQLYIEMEQRCRQAGYLEQQAIILNNLGNQFRSFDANISISYFEKAEEIAGKLKKNRLSAMVDLNKGFTYLETKLWNEAESSFKSCIKTAKIAGDSVMISQAYTGISHILFKKSQCQEAIIYLDSARMMILNKPAEFGWFFIQIEQSLIDQCMGKPEQAYKQLEELLQTAKTIGIPQTVAELSFYLYQINLELGHTAEALEYLQSANSLTDSLKSDTLVSHVVGLYHRAKMKEEQQKYEDQLKEISDANKLYLFILIGLGILVIMLIIRMISISRKKQVLERSEYHSQLRIEELKQFVPEPVMPADIDVQMVLNDVEFQQRLASMYPDLNILEVKICTMIRANFSTKRIAAELDRSVGTIDNYRSIIRRKMNLEEDQNLSFILQSL